MKDTKSILTLGCLAAAAVLIGLGLLEGGYQDVLNKARFLCYECIGIG